MQEMEKIGGMTLTFAFLLLAVLLREAVSAEWLIIPAIIGTVGGVVLWRAKMAQKILSRYKDNGKPH